MSGRQEKVATAIRKEVALLLLHEMRDPRLAGASITHATISRDLTQAKVFVSVLGDLDEMTQAVDALNAASGFVRTKVGPRLHLRSVPEFHFVGDDSAARAQRLDRIFREHESEFGSEPAKADEAEGDE